MFGKSTTPKATRRDRRSLRPIVDTLEQREVLTVNVTFSGGTLTVNMSGTDKRQNFKLQTVPNTLELKYDDGVGYYSVISTSGGKVTAGSVQKVVVNGDNMANWIDLTCISTKTGYKSSLNDAQAPKIIIAGGGGNDVLYGSQFADKIDGGSGDDRINGYDGDDSLIAGGGIDYIYGGFGDDFVSAKGASEGSKFDGGPQTKGDTYSGKKLKDTRLINDFEKTSFI